MNEISVGLLEGLVRSGLALTAFAVAVLIFIRIFPVASPHLRRALWFAVVLQGCMLFRIPVSVPAISLISRPSPHAVPNDPDVELSGDVSHFGFGPSLIRTELTLNSMPAGDAVFPWAGMLILIWGLGATVLVIRSLWRYVQFIRNLPPAASVPREWRDEWDSIQQRAGVNHKVTFYPAPNLGPMLCWHPRGYRLIVPFDVWRLLEPRQRIMILRHELAHVRRGDIWKSFVLRLLALPQWFNPLVWWIVKQFDDDAEYACDDAIRQANPMDVIDYARTLLLFGQSRGAKFLTSQATGGHGLADRIRRLVSPNSRKDSNMKKMVIVTFVLGISALHLLRIQSLAEDQNKQDQTGFSITSTAGALTVTGAGILTLTTDVKTDNPAQPRPTDAVVDVGQVFRNSLEFIKDRDELKRLIAQSEMKAKEKQSEVARKQTELKSATDEAADALRKQLEESAASFDTWRREQSQNFLRVESEIYVKSYKNITAEVGQYAKENGIRIVRKVNRTVTSGNENNTITGSRFYGFQGNAITATPSGTITFVASPAPKGAERGGIMITDNSKGNTATANGIVVQSLELAKGSTLTLEGGKGIVLNVSGTNSNNDLVLSGQDGGVVLNNISVDAKGSTAVVATGNTWANVVSGQQKKPTATGGSVATATKADGITVETEEPRELFKRLAQQEVLYSELGEELDITQEILKRLNEKFEREQATKKPKD